MRTHIFYTALALALVLGACSGRRKGPSTQPHCPPAAAQGVDAALADLGVSTNQLSDVRYGLSFAQDMTLDMRLDPRLRQTAVLLFDELVQPLAVELAIGEFAQ